MNFAAFTFLDNAQPRGLLRWYLGLLFIFCCAISPMRAAALVTDGQTPGMRRSCAAVAPAMYFAAREDQVIFVHVAAHYAEKKYRASLPPARGSALDVNDTFPSAPCNGSFGVNAAGAVRGSGAGNLQLRGHRRA